MTRGTKRVGNCISSMDPSGKHMPSRTPRRPQMHYSVYLWCNRISQQIERKKPRVEDRDQHATEKGIGNRREGKIEIRRGKEHRKSESERERDRERVLCLLIRNSEKLWEKLRFDEENHVREEGKGEKGPKIMALAPVAAPPPAVSGSLSSSLPSLSHCLSIRPTLSLRLCSRRRGQQCRKLQCRQSSRRDFSVRAEVKYVDGEEAKKLVTEEGYTILDIRDRTQYEKAHIIPSVHVPVYIENTDNDLGTVVNRTLHNNFSGLFYGLAFTKPNPDFVSSVEKNFPKDSKLLLVCQEGLRSGAAAEKLERAGFQNLAYISFGLQKVKPGVFEKEGSKELQDAGKGGLVTVQGKISAVLGTVLIVAFLFITFFPTQAEQLFFSK